MKITRDPARTDKPLLDSLPIGSVFHLGVADDQTWLVCTTRNGVVKHAACLETGELRPLQDMPDNVSRLYHTAVVS